MTMKTRQRQTVTSTLHTLKTHTLADRSGAK